MDLQQIGIIRAKEIRKEARGRPEEAYLLSQELYDLWTETIEKDLYGNPVVRGKIQDKVELPKKIIKKRTAIKTTRRLASE